MRVAGSDRLAGWVEEMAKGLGYSNVIWFGFGVRVYEEKAEVMWSRLFTVCRPAGAVGNNAIAAARYA